MMILITLWRDGIMRNLIIKLIFLQGMLLISLLCTACAPRRDIDDAELFFEKNYENLVEMNEILKNIDSVDLVYPWPLHFSVERTG